MCSFASLVGGAYGPSPENPNAVQFVNLKDCDGDVKGHLKSCNILTDIESIDSERKLLFALAGESTGRVIFSVIDRRFTSYLHLPFSLGIVIAQECQFVPNTGRRPRGGWGAQQSFIRRGSAPRSKPLPFYIPFLIVKVPLSYT